MQCRYEAGLSNEHEDDQVDVSSHDHVSNRMTGWLESNVTLLNDYSSAVFCTIDRTADKIEEKWKKTENRNLQLERISCEEVDAVIKMISLGRDSAVVRTRF